MTKGGSSSQIGSLTDTTRMNTTQTLSSGSSAIHKWSGRTPTIERTGSQPWTGKNDTTQDPKET
jgi:hypothetical protein